MENENLRLQVFLSRSGAASRRSSAELIQDGRVRVNGKLITDPGHRVEPEDQITLDNRPLNLVKKNIYIALHKPVQYLCSQADPQGRPLAMDLLKPFFTQRLFHVGRLDYLSSGLILFTNDGVWAKDLLHPSSSLEKEYEIVTKKEVSPDLMERFKRGILIEGVQYRCKSFFLKGPRSVTIVLTEGKNREIRTVFQFFNIPVKKVHRIRIGGVLLKGLAPGRYRELTSAEIKSLAPRPPKKTDSELKKTAPRPAKKTGPETKKSSPRSEKKANPETKRPTSRPDKKVEPKKSRKDTPVSPKTGFGKNSSRRTKRDSSH